MPNDSPTEADKYQALAERFDQRANRLHRQANFLLVITIAVLLFGALGFVFANNIASLTLGRQTTQDQYALSIAALKQNSEQQDALRKQISDIENKTTIAKPFDDKINATLNSFWKWEKTLLQKCTDVTFENRFSVNLNDFHTLSLLRSAPDRIGEFAFDTPDQTVYFAKYDSGMKCRGMFDNARTITTTYLRKIQDITNDRDKAIAKFGNSILNKLQPLEDKLNNLINESNTLSKLAYTLKIQMVQEKVLGSSPARSQTTEEETKENAKIDWTTIIQNNVTRIGALVITFFLVSIIVPQYRYNIRMETFYNARADSLRISSRAGFNWPDDLGKIVNIMTPNIDFGKAPPTPWEHLIEVIKSVKE